jgi:exosortase
MAEMTITKSLESPETYDLRTLWDQRRSKPTRWAAGAVTLVLVLAYFPNLRALMKIWNDDPNYNHGYLVIPIALYILWQQLSMPEPKTVRESVLAPWWGWVFLVGTLLVRGIAYERGSEGLENATIIPATASLVWAFGSWPLLRRAWLAIAYLAFMLPLPLLVSNTLALPLQSFAASSSYYLLQLTGMWVVQHGNIIDLTTAHGTERLDVALACNGLRMLMTMTATVTATVILLPLPNWKRIVLLLSIVPIALVSNMARIVATGWGYYLFTGDTARHWAHDWSGLLMMPLALALVGLELALLSWLVPKESEDDQPVIPLLGNTKADVATESQALPRRGSGKDKKKSQDLDEI